MNNKKSMGIKAIVLLLMVSLLIGGTVGGTLAWITMKTGTVTNTFTAGDIQIALTESDNLDLKMVPGKTIRKDPKVTVTAGNEACWVFLEVTKTNNVDKYIDYAINTANWTPVNETETPNVYYKKLSATEATDDDTELTILVEDKVVVKNTLGKSDMAAINSNNTSLAFTAYAVQAEISNDAKTAWNQAKTLNQQ